MIWPVIYKVRGVGEILMNKANKAAHSGFEIQRRRHQKSKTAISVSPQMDMCPTKILKKDSYDRNRLLTFSNELVPMV